MSHHSEHSYARFFGHFVWATDQRKKMITPIVEEKLYPYIGQICKNLDIHMLAIGGTEDHVHILLQLPIKISLPNLVARIKSNSCRLIREADYGGFSWQHGYGFFSTEASCLLRLKNYITSQKEHHKQKSYEDECRELIK